MPNRRAFLGLLGLAPFAPSLRAASFDASIESAKTFGSGHFGEWTTDSFGLPAYRYTCDQRVDPKARTSTHSEFRAPTDHLHQVGNDRLVAIVSNYGYAQVRQDEGAPKFLNDYAPELHRYGGGIGFLTDGENTLSTYLSRDVPAFERTFGVGYFRKQAASDRYELDQVLFAPFGDDPVLISQVTIRNKSVERAKLRWTEYWDCQPYEFSYRSLLESPLPGGSVTRAATLRREFADQFTHEFQALADGAGLVEQKRFHGRTIKDRATWTALSALLHVNPDTFMGGPIPDLPKGADFEDQHPPPTFLVSLDAPADRTATSSEGLFDSGSQPALVLERAIELAPGESRTIHLMYGYLPAGFELDALIAKYRSSAPTLWASSSAAWKADGLRLCVPSAPWVERETTWHSYYLRSSATFDSYFGEHILSQGGLYQYVLGFQAAARDPLQHALPLVFSNPQLAREVLRYTLKEMKADGSIPYGIVGAGVPMPVIFRPSDLQLWLLWLASEYVLATRDHAFLDESIADLRVRDLLAKAYRCVIDTIGVGAHGLMRLSNGDWSDAIVGDDVTPDARREITAKGESVLNAAMASYVLDRYASLLCCIGDESHAHDVRTAALHQREAVGAQWTGRWFRRAWLGPALGWVGEKQIWLEPQPWAILGGAATGDQVETLADELDRGVRRASPIGAMLHSQPLPKADNPGVLTNGGVWASINGTLVWALAKANPSKAWDEWKKNSLAAHADAYPDIWYGIWSGPDAYNSVLARHPGATMSAADAPGKPDAGLGWTDFPVMNLHAHAWPLYSAAKLLGLEFHETGFRLAPALPLAEYSFRSPLFGFMKTAKGYSGWYAPAIAGNWQMELRLPGRAPIRRFGRSEPGRPMQWSIPP